MAIENKSEDPLPEDEPTSRVRILIADDHPLVRDAVAAMISDVAQWEICGAAADGPETIRQALALRPDVIVMDLRMPGFNGVEAIREIKRQVPSAELVVFSGERPGGAVAELFHAGAKGFVSKNASSARLIEAIEEVAAHRAYITPDVSDILVASMLDEATQPAETRARVTAREREIIRHIAEGESNKEIAAALGISSRTAETHRATILRKLGASSVAEIVRYAVRNGIIEP